MAFIPTKLNQPHITEHSTISDQSTKDRGNGRWLPQEHLLFIEALKVYGKKWKKIEKYIGTRTSTQIRSHAQKYFIKLKKSKEKTEVANDNATPSEHNSHPSAMSIQDIKLDSSKQETQHHFLVTIHKSTIVQKKSQIKAISKDLELVQGSIDVLELQIKEFYEKGYLLVNIESLLMKATQLMNELFIHGAKLCSKGHISKRINSALQSVIFQACCDARVSQDMPAQHVPISG